MGIALKNSLRASWMRTKFAADVVKNWQQMLLNFKRNFTYLSCGAHSLRCSFERSFKPQAAAGNCNQCNNSNGATTTLTNLPQFLVPAMVVSFSSLIIFNNSSEIRGKKWRSSSDSWILWVWRCTLICGLFATLLATSALHFLRPNVIWLAVSVSVSMTLWLALRSTPDAQHPPPTVSLSFWHLKRNELHAQR